jgi:predicted amidohydrolase
MYALEKCDLIIKNGWVVDPKNRVNGVYDIGISGCKVAFVAESPGSVRAGRTIDATGKLVMPGIVDSHAHIPGRGLAHRAMALAGVTTAIDYGRFQKMLDELPAAGAGLNVGALEILGPWVKDEPALVEVGRQVDQIMEEGALGPKIMGGHSPSNPGATAKIIQAANNRTAYVGYHVGTTASSSNLLGIREMFDLAGRNRLHVAHVNAYVRGMIRPATDEALETFEGLAKAYWMVSESHLGPRNGTGGAFEGDVPKDWVTRNCLKMANYPLTRDGMKQAFLDGYAAVTTYRGGAHAVISGEEGLRIWEEANTQCGVSFPVNTRTTAMMCATAKVKRQDGTRDFVIDAISTDGGSWRNYIAQNGLALWQFGALTIEEFVNKASYVPALLYGMVSKGHLTPGADADVSILDHERHSAYATIVGGKVAMLDGVVLGCGATIVTTSRGEAGLKRRGFETRVVNIEESLFWTKGDKDPGPGTIEIV